MDNVNLSEPLQLNLINELDENERTKDYICVPFEDWQAFSVKEKVSHMLKQLAEIEKKLQELKPLYNLRDSLVLKLKDAIGVNTEVEYEDAIFKVVDNFNSEAVFFKTVPVRRFELIIKKKKAQ